MKILWLCHLIPGAVKEAATGKKESGLWLDHVLDDLREKGARIHVICKELDKTGSVDESCTYSGFHEIYGHKYIPEHEEQFRKELRAFRPDVIHIWGTEYAHSLAMLKAAGIGVAMINGSDEVKAVADYITTRDNNHDGVAEAADKFFYEAAED